MSTPEDTLRHSENCLRNATFYPMSTVSTGPSCLLVGAHVHCLSSCLVYISGSMLITGRDYSPPVRTSQLLVSLDGHQLNMTRVVWIVDCISPWLWPESSSVAPWDRRRAAIRSHTKRVSKLDWDGFVEPGKPWTSCSSNGARIIRVLHIVSPCALYRSSWSHPHQRTCNIIHTQLTHVPKV